MFKRLFWLTTGAGFGFGMSLWVQRTVKRTAARYSPPRLAGDLATTVRTAVSEGRTVMREREAALRSTSSN
jgi:hypothetical protein